jgi:hypothetical protein
MKKIVFGAQLFSLIVMFPIIVILQINHVAVQSIGDIVK